MDESANLPTGGSKTVSEPSTDLDNPENLNFWEPEEEANPTEQGDGIGSETDEVVDDDQETGEPADDGIDDEGQGDEPAASDIADDTIIALPGGDQVPLSELRLGYMRERDYRTKTMNVANRGRALDQMATRVGESARAIAQFLAEQLPEEPSHVLAVQNPAEYTRQKAIYDASMSNVARVMEMAKPTQEVGQQLTEAERLEKLDYENTKLNEAFPTLTNPKARETFFAQAFETAEHFGFPPEETSGVTDHRLFRIMHYARLGMQAEQAKAKALEKVHNAPASVPRIKATGQGAQKARKNADAMRRLSETGSMKDALQIDF